MIEGLHFDLSSDEMREHLATKAEHHTQRAVWYLERAKDLQDGGMQSDHQVSGGDPLKNLQAQAEKHTSRADFFKFLTDHIIGETYRLSESDLRTLEFIGGHYF